MSTISNHNYFYSLSTIRSALERAISSVSDNISCYCADPVSDFTRNRKLCCSDLIHYILHLSNKTIQSDMMDYFSDIDDMPSASAVSQQRHKCKPEAFKRVFSLFTSYFTNYKTYNGYYLLACDGSDINISHNPKDKTTYHINTSATRGYNQLHLNALYDVLNGIYVDVNIDTAAKTHECGALEEMIENHQYPQNSIIICDRGYEKYNLMASCIEKNQKFIIRVKDIHSNGILSTMHFEDTAFDTHITKRMTYLQTNETKDNEIYTLLVNASASFDYLPADHDYYEMNLRAVRFKITDDTYECLLTNLTEDEMTFEELKEIYHLRWGIETSFRDLKYTVGMLYFHSSNQQLIRQEIYASLTLFNFSRIIINNTPPDQKEEWKYHYKVNFKTALTNIRLYLDGKLTEAELAKRIKKFLSPIRPGRKYSRNVKAQSAKTSSYYAAQRHKYKSVVAQKQVIKKSSDDRDVFVMQKIQCKQLKQQQSQGKSNLYIDYYPQLQYILLILNDHQCLT